MASAKRSSFDQFQQLLDDLPYDILQPLGSEIETEKTQSVEKYVYPSINTSMTAELQQYMQMERFGLFKELLDELDTIKEKASSQPSEPTLISSEDPKIGQLNFQDSLSLAYRLQVVTLSKASEENKTEINNLMEEVIKKRQQMKNISLELDKIKMI